ncbi:MAG: SufS family cysteine desulfurase [Fibrobacter sp.]|nr:SufS family cysteine desulfurase [Fibrobacter sp.]
MDIKKIRNDFPILMILEHGKPLIYLDNAATTQKPQHVLNSIYSFYSRSYSNVHRGIYALSEKASELFENARKMVKNFINAQKTHEIIFTQGTTSSINIVAMSFVNNIIKSDDEILISQLEHHSNFVPWQVICKNKGSKLKIIPMDNAGTIKLTAVSSLITEKTKFIALTHVSNVTGVINPVKEIIRYAHSHEIPVLIDGAQSIAHMPVDVTDLDCDFFVFSGHKIYAETGIGILYGKEKWLDRMQPYQYGGGMISKVTCKHTTFAELPFKFEAGTQNLSGAISLGAAINYINGIGLQNMYQHESDLTRYALKNLSSLSNIKIYSPDSQISSIISFNLEDISPYDACLLLDNMGITLRSGNHCAQPLMDYLGIFGTARVSFAVYNNFDEIDALIEGIKKVQSTLLK